MSLYSNAQLENFAKFVLHLITNGAMPISILKVIEFGELDKPTLRFVRQMLLGILLGDQTVCVDVSLNLITNWFFIIYNFHFIPGYPDLPAHISRHQIEGIQRQPTPIHASFPNKKWSEKWRVSGTNWFDQAARSIDR